MEKVEYYFREISRIPRGSYNEKAICDYVENFAKEKNIKYVKIFLGSSTYYPKTLAFCN